MFRLGRMLLKGELPALAAQAIEPDLARSLSGLGMAPRRRLELPGKARAAVWRAAQRTELRQDLQPQIPQRVLNHISEAGDL